MIALMIAAVVATAEPPPILRDNPKASPEQHQTQPPILRQPPGGVPALLPLYGVSTDEKGVTVSLNGCGAMKSDFTVAISKSADRPTVLFARRGIGNNLVLCGPRSQRMAFTWTYDELGLKPGQQFSLANPLVMAPLAVGVQPVPGS
jgi:hypothetical protein